MAKPPDLAPLIDVLGGDAPPPERRRALRAAALDERGIEDLIAMAMRKRSDEPEAAQQIATSALAAGRAAGLPGVVVSAARVLAQAWIVLGKPKSALRLYRQHAHAAGPDDDASLTLELAQTLSMLGLRDEAADAIDECRRRMPDQGATYPLALLDAAEASLLHGAGFVEEALVRLERARPALAAEGDRSLVASVDANRASALSALGRYEEAERLYRTAGDALEAIGQHAAALHAQFGHADALMRVGRFHDALRRLDAVRRELATGQNERLVAACQLAEAEINLALNMPSQAWRAALEARSTFESLGITDERAKADFFAALAARALGRTMESVHRLEAAYGVFSRPGGEAADAALCLYRMAEADKAVQETGRGAARAERAHAALSALGWNERAARAAVLLAEFETEGGELDTAHGRLTALLGGEHRCRSPWVLCEIHHKLGLVEEMRGNRWRAAVHVLRSTRLLERYRAAVPPDEYMAAFLTGRTQLFDDAIRIVGRMGGRHAEARSFELSEQARARALLDLIRTRQVGRGVRTESGSSVELELDHAERRLQGGLASMPGGGAGAPDAAVLGRFADSVSESEARLRNCLDRLAQEDPDRARDRRGAPVRLETLLERLPADDTIVEYFFARDEILVFVVDRRRGLRVHRKARDGEALRRMMSRMRYHLDRPSANDAAESLQAAQDVLEELDELLLGGVREGLETRRVVVIPHGPLHGIPFPALTRRGRPLIEDHEVLVAPSVAIYLHSLTKPYGTGSGALLLGVASEREPGAAAEVERLAPLLADARVYVDERATAAILEREGRRARVVHLAAHTEHRHDDPMQSRIRLGDGWLTIPRIYELELSPDLLVLSGSATGRVAVTQGGDLFGLVRGFLHAGVPTLLTSLWEVSDDRTLEFMERFYRALAETQGCASGALRQAALGMREAHRHPYAWAPFVLTGRCGCFHPGAPAS